MSGTNIAWRFYEANSLSYMDNHILAAICLVNRKNRSWSQGVIAIKITVTESSDLLAPLCT
jgi:hypothetical protein